MIGETGSGKTTQIPQFLYHSRSSERGIIAVTQPRRVAAISISTRVAKEMKTRLGDVVGYTVRFEDHTSRNTKIKFVTDGSLLREALTDRQLLKYSVIILDEAHERTINTDVLFGIVKEAQRKRKNANQTPLKVHRRPYHTAEMKTKFFGQFIRRSLSCQPQWMSIISPNISMIAKPFIWREERIQ